MNQNRSVATIDAPEFINIEPYNPLISTCEIKVLYIGENRNRSYIDKNTAIQMANSLPGTPIVGAFREDVDDFGDHGHVMRIEDGEVYFSCKTRPYGFVAPDAQVWFKKFIEIGENGQEIEREYLMTTGYLWTSQYEEAMQCLEAGKGQSMELDEDSLDGYWATSSNSGIDFFIINDAVFSKLCILGDDVEPCFEGAAITSPEISMNFKKDNDFSHTLFSMMKELKDALQNEGGSDMPEEFSEQQEEVVEETAEDIDVSSESAEVEFTEDDSETEVEEEVFEEEVSDEEAGIEAYADEEESVEESKPAVDDDDNENSTGKKPVQHSLEEFELLQEQYDILLEEVSALREFKLNIENAQKDAVINKYHMLSDEDKAEVIEHKTEYSLDEIESKLALIYVQRNVDFSTLTGEVEETTVEDEEPSITFSLDSEVAGFAPASEMLEALRQTKRID